jgi:hypothetical protein
MLFPRLASAFVSAILKLMSLTWKTRFVRRDSFEKLRAAGEPYIFALWHGRMLVPIWTHRGESVATMASKSKDGEIIARWLERNGYVALRGSTNKGGARGIVRLIRHLTEGRAAALTVDGSKGPPRVVQEGVVTLARKTGAWILPISYSATRPRFLNSWDRYLLPRLFSGNVVVYGEPFKLGKETDAEALSKIASAIDSATAEADRAAGISPPAPW